MKYLSILLLILPLSLFAYSDADMDGVEDALDRCPNTPLMDLVDINGCSKKTIIKASSNSKKVSPHHFDIVVGASYSQTSYDINPTTETINTSLQVDYYYKNFSLSLSGSHYNTSSGDYSDSGLNDSFAGMGYNFRPTKNLSLRLGAGVSIPTYDSYYDNNNYDYVGSASLSYKLGSVNIFGGYTYTMINDDDYSYTDDNNQTQTVTYQDTTSYNVGLGFYPTSKLYLSASYMSADSVYEGVDASKTASIYAYYGFNAHWFSSLSYAYGLNDVATDHYASLKLGYYF